MTTETCVYCGKTFDPDKQSPFGDFNCSFHPMQPQSIGDTGPRGDHAELWIFPCCGKRHVGEVEAGRDVVPRRSPGCLNCFHATARSTAFISYARADGAFVHFLETELQRRGYFVWRDTSDLIAGEEWRTAIRTAIDACTHVILVVSNTSLSRPEVNREIGAAAQAGRPLIAIVIDDFELPAWIQHLNYIDWRSYKDSAHSLDFVRLDNALGDPGRMKFLNRIRLGRTHSPDGA